MVFGQVVIGPPGSGKSTYCEGMRQYLTSLGRKVAVANLDPANDMLPYPAAFDVRELISLEGAARVCELGPNGALVYCLEYLSENIDWLLEQLEPLADAYVLFDLPGQVPGVRLLPRKRRLDASGPGDRWSYIPTTAPSARLSTS